MFLGSSTSTVSVGRFQMTGPHIITATVGEIPAGLIPRFGRKEGRGQGTGRDCVLEYGIHQNPQSAVVMIVLAV